MMGTKQKHPIGGAWHPIWKKLNDLYDLVAVTALLLVIFTAGYCLYDSLYIYTHTADAAQLALYKPSPQTGMTQDSPITDQMVGWLTMDGTDIDYPVMQGEDNAEFLNKDPYGKFSLSGSIFLDSRNTPSFDDGYAIIYGHHMEYGKMFGALDRYLDEDYARRHAHGTLLIGRDGQESRELEVFAVAETHAAEKVLFHMSTVDQVRRYMADHASFQFFEPEGNMLALTTCADTSADARIVVMCEIREQTASPS